MILELLERLTALVYIESSVLGFESAVGCHIRNSHVGQRDRVQQALLHPESENLSGLFSS